MLTSAATSCMRHGRSFSVSVARISLLGTGKNSATTLNRTGVQDLSRLRPSRVLTSTPWHLQSGLRARSVSQSPASNGGTETTGPVSVPSETDSPDCENFGAFSADMASRRLFKKSSPYLQALQYREEEDEELEPMKPRRSPRRRNTPYWYFLQCKRLIKENKVGMLEVITSVFFGVCRLPFVFNPRASSDSCRRLWTCSAETCCRGRGCSRRSSTTLSW